MLIISEVFSLVLSSLSPVLLFNPVFVDLALVDLQLLLVQLVLQDQLHVLVSVDFRSQ